MTVSHDDRAVIVYHRGGQSIVNFAIDLFSGVGIFDLFIIPNTFVDDRLMWPYITSDRTGRYHVVETENSEAGAPQRIGYTRSSNGGVTWTTLADVDTVRVISPIVVSSPVSDKVAIIYSHPTDSTQLRNDVYYIQSTDGMTWDWANGKINVTNYGHNGDSLFAYTDLAAVYDYNDNLHIVWNSQWIGNG